MEAMVLRGKEAQLPFSLVLLRQTDGVSLPRHSIYLIVLENKPGGGSA